MSEESGSQNEIPGGRGWEFRMHYIYYPFLVFLIMGLFAMAVTYPLDHLFLPLAQDAFLGIHVPGERTPVFYIFLAVLPLSLALAPMLVWAYLNGLFNYRGPRVEPLAGNGMPLALPLTMLEMVIRPPDEAHAMPGTAQFRHWHRKAVVPALLWLALFYGVALFQANHYYSVGTGVIIFDDGHSVFAHRHTWQDVTAIDASCTSASDFKNFKGSFTLNFTNGDSLDVMPENPYQLFRVLPDLQQSLQGKTVSIKNNPASDCPAAWSDFMAQLKG